MKKIKFEFELPDEIYEEFKGRRWYIYAGVELAAYKHPDDDKAHAKRERCSMCGECCKQCDDRWIYPHVDGVCVHLNEQNMCGLGLNRPWACGWPVWHHGIEQCTERFDDEDDKHQRKPTK